MKQVLLGIAFWGAAAVGTPVQAQVYQTEGIPASADTPAARVLPQVAPVRTPVRRVVVPKPKPLTREVSLGFRLKTDGWGLFFERGAVKTDESGARADMFHNVQLWTAEFSEHKDPQQYRSSTASDPSGGGRALSKPFIYGKINNFYSLKLGYAYRRMIAGKPEPGTVSIHWVYGGGLALGLEKPYYIDAYTNKGEETIKYTPETAEYFLNQDRIIGGTSFLKGLNDIGFVPGLHAKTGLHFDFATGKKGKLAVETGVSAELYTRGVQLMASGEPRSLFTNLYASIQIGRRYAGKQ